METAGAANRGDSLTPEGEAQWLRLKQHLEWSETFSLGFIFSCHPEVIQIFKARLAAIYKARVTKLNTSIPSLPEELTETLLPLLLNPSENKIQLKQPFWLDLSAESGTDWQKARVTFLIRLNEQRESLRRTLHCPVILILPQKERYEIKTLVPDLWAIRDFSMETRQWVNALSLPIFSNNQTPSRIPFESPQDKSMIKEWRRLMERESKDRGFLSAAQRAFKSTMKTGQYELAAAIAKSQYDFCIKNKETPEALRDLSVSLENMGNTALVMGQWETAEQFFQESLDVRRKILAHVGETPEALRDLSVSLDNVGNTARAMGQWEKARQLFNESLGVRRKILGRVGETPEALRDLSVSLNNVGNTARAMGQWEKARQLFKESLDVSRKILARVGETPEALRDLSVSLNNVGNTARAMGQWEKARQLFKESLDVSRNILARVGETPEALRDLSVSLDNVGNTAQAMGQWEKAGQLFNESLDVRRNILARVGETPEALRDLSVSFYNAGETAQSLKKFHEARKFFQEGLNIARKLSKAFSDLAAYRTLESNFRSRLEALEEDC